MSSRSVERILGRENAIEHLRGDLFGEAAMVANWLDGRVLDRSIWGATDAEYRQYALDFVEMCREWSMVAARLISEDGHQIDIEIGGPCNHLYLTRDDAGVYAIKESYSTGVPINDGGLLFQYPDGQEHKIWRDRVEMGDGSETWRTLDDALGVYLIWRYESHPYINQHRTERNYPTEIAIKDKDGNSISDALIEMGWQLFLPEGKDYKATQGMPPKGWTMNERDVANCGWDVWFDPEGRKRFSMFWKAGVMFSSLETFVVIHPIT